MLGMLKGLKKAEDTVSSHEKLRVQARVKLQTYEIIISKIPEQSKGKWQMIIMLDNSKTGKRQVKLQQKQSSIVTKFHPQYRMTMGLGTADHDKV